jgi:hypothetical protein
MADESPQSGWTMIASEDEAASVIAGLVNADTEREFARSEIAELADIPLKTLYLIDTVDTLVTLGVLTRVDNGDADSEEHFQINEDNDVYHSAVQFDEAVRDQLGK